MTRPTRSSLLAAAAVAATLLGGCASYIPVGGVFVGGTTGVAANPGVATSKMGQSCMKSVMGVVAWGNASIDSAMRAGQISKVATVDYRVKNVLGVFGKYCTIVRGE